MKRFLSTLHYGRGKVVISLGLLVWVYELTWRIDSEVLGKLGC